MSSAASSQPQNGAFATSRVLPASPAQVFAAMSNPERVARWWGPAGFTNTIEVFDFAPGGQWLLTMHGPDGSDYPNHHVFIDIVPESKLVIDHISDTHYFRLTISLAAAAGGTAVSWHQAFDSHEEAERVATIVIPANEQNLDRLAAEVARNGN